MPGVVVGALVAVEGTVAELHGLARTVVSVAAAHQVTQIVVGATRRSRWDERRRGSVVRRILQFAADVSIDVHVLARREPARVAEDGGSAAARARAVGAGEGEETE